MLKRCPELLEGGDRIGGFTPLYRAAQRGFTDMTKYLIKKGASVESTKGDGSTPFYIGK